MDDDDVPVCTPPAFVAANCDRADQARAARPEAGRAGGGFELKGKAVLQLAEEDGAVVVKLARRLSMTPEWDRQSVRSGADQRKLLDEVKRRLERWQRED